MIENIQKIHKVYNILDLDIELSSKLNVKFDDASLLKNET